MSKVELAFSNTLLGPLELPYVHKYNEEELQRTRNKAIKDLDGLEKLPIDKRQEVKGIRYRASISVAGHYALLIDDQIFHLHWIRNDKGKPVAVNFGNQRFTNLSNVASMEILGYTRYGMKQVNAIGDILITTFGDYHNIYWNCQHFANLLLELICEEKPKKSITASDVLRMTMISSIVSSPTAISGFLEERKSSKMAIEETKKVWKEALAKEKITKVDLEEIIAHQMVELQNAEGEQKIEAEKNDEACIIL